MGQRRGFDRQFPGQEHLGAVQVGREVGLVEAAAVAGYDGVGLAGVKQHHRAPAQLYTLARQREMQVQRPVLAEKQIAKRRAAVLRGVVVVAGAPAGH